MAKSTRTKKHLKRRSEELALTERRVFLSLAVLLALASAIDPILGLHGASSTTTGLGAGLSALGGWLRR
jgi:hypothetical protein